MKYIILFLFTISTCYAQSNSVYIDQVGSNNEVVINQSGVGHKAGVAIGTYLPANSNDLTTGYGIGTQAHGGTADYNYVGISQQGAGTKTATVEMPTSSYNYITTFQDGNGNHTAAIQNLQGNSNNISILQDGSGNHSMNIVGTTGTINSNNNINSTQTGAGDKSFALTLNGSSGASVTVQQTNPTQANQGSMSIQCNPCGAYSYIRQ